MRTTFKSLIFLLCLGGAMLSIQSCQKEEIQDTKSPHVVEMMAEQFTSDSDAFNPNDEWIGKKIPEASIELKQFSSSTRSNGSFIACEEVLSPNSLTATLQPGMSISEVKTACLEGLPPKGDVIFMPDLTGSMGGELSNLKINSINIMNEVASNIADAQFGLASFMDYSGTYIGECYSNQYGGSIDYPYSLDHVISSDIASVSTAIENLSLGYGGDFAESYARALYESVHDPNIEWRDGAAKIIVMWGDAIPHTCDLPFPVLSYGNPFATTTGNDPGRDAIIDNEDDIYMSEVIQEMIDENIVLLFLESLDFANVSGLKENWDLYTEQTGGQAFSINSNGTIPGGEDLATTISDLIESNIANISSLSLEADPPTFSNWISNVSPMAHNDITLNETQEFEYDITFTVPDGTPDGLYEFEVDLVGDGAVYGSQTVSITVLTDSDGDGCLDDVDPHPISDQSPTIVIDGCDSGVINQVVSDDGCSTMSDLLADCAANSSNHGKYVSCVSKLTNGWKKDGLITGAEKGAIVSCAAQSNYP